MALAGELVYLREEREEDLPLLIELRNDLETQGWSKTLPPTYTMPMYQKRFGEMEFSYDPKEARFIVVHNETGETCGTISYSELQKRISATIGIVIAKKFWGKGVAFDAQEVLLEFLFEELGLRVVHLFTHSGNQAAIKLALKSGFRIGVRQREAIFKAGQLFDNLTMDIIREEYYERHPALTDRLPKIEA